MRWPTLSAIDHARIQRRRLWHKWFAWHPVCLSSGIMVWLEQIERRGGFDHRKNRAFGNAPWRWEYRSQA